MLQRAEKKVRLEYKKGNNSQTLYLMQFQISVGEEESQRPYVNNRAYQGPDTDSNINF